MNKIGEIELPISQPFAIIGDDVKIFDFINDTQIPGIVNTLCEFRDKGKEASNFAALLIGRGKYYLDDDNPALFIHYVFLLIYNPSPILTGDKPGKMMMIVSPTTTVLSRYLQNTMVANRNNEAFTKILSYLIDYVEEHIKFQMRPTYFGGVDPV